MIIIIIYNSKNNNFTKYKMSLIKENLKEYGLKVTQPRVEILKLFEDFPNKHFTIDEISNSLKKNSTGIATIYRVLNQFESIGLINKLKLDDEQVRYELNTGEHHDHIICIKCNKIIEFYDEKLEKLQEKIVKRFNAKLIDHNLNIYVECENCLNNKKN